MAGWQDFISAIDRNIDNNRKGFGKWLDKPLPGFISNNSAYKGARNFNNKVAEPVLNKAADFTTDLLQSIPRGAVEVGLTLKESSRNNNLDSRNTRIDTFLGISEQERDRLASLMDDPEAVKRMTPEERDTAFSLKSAKRELGGLSDELLQKRKEANIIEKNTNMSYKAGNPLTKALVGGEEDEVANSSQGTARKAELALLERGYSEDKAKGLGTGAGIAVAGLNLPGLPGKQALKDPAKVLGKKGLKLLSKESSQEAVETTLKKAIPDITDESLKKIAPKVAKSTDENVIAKIVNNYKTPESALDPSEEVLSVLRTSSSLKDNKKPFLKGMQEQWVDKLSPMNEMVKTIEARTGKKLTTEDNPYELMRLHNGMSDVVKQRVSSLQDVIGQSPDLDAVRIIGLARQVQGRAGRGISSSFSAETAAKAIEQQRNKLGLEKFTQAAKVVDEVNAYNRELLLELNRAGMVSDDALRAIEEVGGDYFARMNVIEYMMKDSSNRALFASSGSYNATKQSLKKALASAKGMEIGTEILDPIESIIKSTDTVMRSISKNNIGQAMNRLSDIAPDIIPRIKDPENVVERIALSMDNKQMRPVRNKLERMLSTKAKSMRRLESEVNKLEKKGLNTSLKKGGQRMDTTPFSVDGLGGKVPTSQAEKMIPSSPNAADAVSQLGPKDTGAFVRNLIENGSQSDINRLKKMVGTRDTKMSALLDQISSMKSEYDEVADAIKTNRAKIAELQDKNKPKGTELITFMDKGVEGKLAVPVEIAQLYTGKNKAQQDYLTKFMSSINTFVKQNLTGNNPAFALITNPIRDSKSFAYNAQDVKSDPLSIGKALAEGFWSRVMRKDDAYQRWIAAGGKSGFYADSRTGDQLARELTREISGKKVLGMKIAPVNNAKDLFREVGRIVATPLRKMQDVASILEDTPRLAQFKASVKAGDTDASAAFKSRNVTVDFQKSGTIGQVANSWVPFLNARLQGNIITLSSLKKNPGRAATVYAGLTAAPIIAAALSNSRYPEVMKMVSDGERDNNFVVILGDEKDENGDYRQIIKIPKGDVDKILGNPLEQIARMVADDDPDTLIQTLLNMGNAISPIDFVREDALSPQRAVSGILPAAIKAPIEATTNKNLYFGSDIVPRRLEKLPASEQVDESTSAAGKFLGSITGTSPKIADNTIKNFSGNLITKSPVDQIGGKLSGVSQNKMNDVFYSTLDKTSKNRASASKFINEAIATGDIAAAQQAAKSYNEYLKEQFTPFGETYGAQMTKELADTYEAQKINLTSRSIKQRKNSAIKE